MDEVIYILNFLAFAASILADLAAPVIALSLCVIAYRFKLARH